MSHLFWCCIDITPDSANPTVQWSVDAGHWLILLVDVPFSQGDPTLRGLLGVCVYVFLIEHGMDVQFPFDAVLREAGVGNRRNIHATCRL